jgi:hypothetical protein
MTFTGRYIQVSDVEESLKLGALTTSTFPTLNMVEQWITSAESELDGLTRTQWDEHTVTEEYVHLPATTNTIYTAHSPITAIITLERNEGDEWSENWTTIAATDYKIINYNTGKILTKDYFWNPRGLRITYKAGYATEDIPQAVKDLALILVEKRYISNKLKQSAIETDSVVSVGSIKLSDKSKQSYEYRINGINAEVKELTAQLSKALKAKTYAITEIDFAYPRTKRYRL